jgi:hypothetical protein
MANAPARPASVPAEAVWSEDVESWEIGGRSADGRRRGLCTFYRPDGQLYLRGEFEAGVQHGPFSMFHPDGTVAREGTFTRGELDGDLVAHASENPTTVPLRGCCVPENARTLRAMYRQGQLVREAFYDAEDHELSPEGVRIPDRPASVPPEARFDDISWRWRIRTAKDPGSHIDRYLTPEGALSEELEYSGGVKVTQRLFDAQGRLRETSGFDAEGRLHGPALKRVPDGEPSPHADPRVRAERGDFDHGHPVGRRDLLGDGDVVLRTIDFGAPWPPDGALAPALLDETTDAEGLWAAAASLRTDGRAREALCVAARAAVLGGDPGRLRAFVTESTLQLTPELTRARGEALSNDSEITFVAVLDELLTGADPVAAFRTLATVLERAPRLAHDLIEAALLLEPANRLFHFTRGLLRLELGDDVGATVDARLFWPVQQALPHPTEATPELEIGQPLEAVRHQIQVYATRQQHFRAALQKLRGGQAPTRWLPPDCSALLPDGPLVLRHDTVTIVEENEDGVEEETQVAFDERIHDRVTAMGTTLLSAARANWAALTWLCWAAGLDQVALPEHLEPRADYAVAVATALERRYRARDLLTTGGILARSRGVAGFIWEGFDIDSLHRRLAMVLADECQEIRAVFLWSMWAQNVSPFQDDLRPD